MSVLLAVVVALLSTATSFRFIIRRTTRPLTLPATWPSGSLLLQASSLIEPQPVASSDLKPAAPTASKPVTWVRPYNHQHSPEFERQALQLHRKLHPDHVVYAWVDVPEDVLIKSGFIEDSGEWRRGGKTVREYGLDGI
ncbi:hypothetical protein B484DRAFT_201803, partial [Ochromonadaceae sp. CCMP2298]